MIEARAEHRYCATTAVQCEWVVIGVCGVSASDCWIGDLVVGRCCISICGLKKRVADKNGGKCTSGESLPNKVVDILEML